MIGGQRWLLIPLLLVLALIHRAEWPPFEPIREAAFDRFQRWAPASPSSGHLVLVEIDDASVKRLGQFPWSRAVMADLTERLTDAGATVGFAIHFAQPDRLSPDQLVLSLSGLDRSSMQALLTQPSTDTLFAQAIKGGRVVLASELAPTGGERPPQIKIALAMMSGSPINALDYVPRTEGTVEPMRALSSVATGIGFATMVPDSDGVVRRVPSFAAGGGRMLPSLSLEIARVTRGNTAVIVRTSPTGLVDAVMPPDIIVPTDPRGFVRPRFATALPPRLSLASLLEKPLDRGTFDGKTALIGATAIGLERWVPTPVGPLGHHEITAITVDNMLSGRLLLRPAWAGGAETLTIVGGGLVLLIGAAWLATPGLLVLGLGMAALSVGGSWILFRLDGWLLDGTGTALVVTALLFVVLAFRSAAPRSEATEARSRLDGAARVRRRAAARLHAAESEFAAADRAQKAAQAQARMLGVDSER